MLFANYCSASAGVETASIEMLVDVSFSLQQDFVWELFCLVFVKVVYNKWVFLAEKFGGIIFGFLEVRVQSIHDFWVQFELFLHLHLYLIHVDLLS